MQKLAPRIAATVAIACALAFAAVALFSLLTFSRAERMGAEAAARAQIDSMADILAMTYHSLEATGERRMKRLKALLEGKVSVASAHDEADARGLPVLRFEGARVNDNPELLGKWQKLLGAEATLVLLNGQGEPVRAATLLSDENGNSLAGSVLAADTPEAAAVKAGQEWLGVVSRDQHYYVSAFLPIRDAQGQVLGAWSVRSDVGDEMQQLRDTFLAMKFGDTGYPYVLKLGQTPEESTFVMHPKFEGMPAREIPGPFMDIVRAMSAQPEGTYSYMFEGPDKKDHEKIVVFKTVPNWGWVVAGGSWLSEYTKNASALRWQLALACLLGALISAIASWFATRWGLQGVDAVAEGMRHMGAGDLSRSIPEARCEIGVIAREANTARSQIGGLIRELSTSSRNAFESSGRLDGTANQVAAAAEEQSSQATTLAAAVEELSVSISHTADQAGYSAQAAHSTLECSQQGLESAVAVAAEMRRIVEETTSAESLMSQMAANSSQIAGIAEAISDIAEQTNLLALNAAIEAARAGEAGSGFAVVADEVRKLAEKSTQFTSKISQVLEQTVGDTHQATEATRQIAGQANHAAQLAAQAEQALHAIAEASQRAVEAANEIASANREQGSAGQSIAQSVEVIAQMAEANTQRAHDLLKEVHTMEGVARTLEESAQAFRT